MKIAIIGNGICSLTSAFKLALEISKTDEIFIIGEKRKEGSASNAAAAMLNSFAELESTSLKDDIDKYNFQISRKATLEWPEFNNLINETIISNSTSKKEKIDFSCGLEYGTFVINNSAANHIDDENFDFIVKSLDKYKVIYENVCPKDIPFYKPSENKRATRSIYIRNEGWINPRRFINKIENALKTFSNVFFIEDNVNQIICNNHKISHLLIGKENKSFYSDKYLLAAGANSKKILEKSSLPITMPSIFYGVGVSIELKSNDEEPTKCIRTPNRGLACGIYAAPYEQLNKSKNNHLLIGATNFVSVDPLNKARVSNVESLLKASIEQVNHDLYRSEIIRTNIGWRPMTEDTYPLIGKTDIENLIILCGTNRDGFHKSPIYSNFISSLILEKDIDNGINIFSPCRKLIRSLTREEAIEKSLKHLLSADYQHGFIPSVSRMPEKIESMYRDDLERLHDKVGAHNWGIPTEMLDMYRYGHAGKK